MAASGTLPDYYAVLQVQPDADIEVISAAYRQLMKKYHPDVAGADPKLIAEHHRRSKDLNEAFGVLRDLRRRKHYDHARLLRGSRRPPTPASQSTHTQSAPSPPPPRPEPQPVVEPEPFTLIAEDSPTAYLAPVRLVAEAYYLLPGRYEWEPERREELLTILSLPLVGTVAFCNATGRLAPLIGHSMTATVVVWAMLGLAALLMRRSLPRIAVAAVPVVALVTGILEPVQSQIHMPVWMAASILGSVSLFVAGRQFVFGMLPTVGFCWLLTRLASA